MVLYFEILQPFARDSRELHGILHALGSAKYTHVQPLQSRVYHWIANTKYGSPWIVLGATPTEEEFWDNLQTNSLLENYAPQKPAQQMQVYFMTQEDAIQMENIGL